MALSEDQARAVVLIKGDKSEGTGFLIRMPDGPVVITNLHVLANNPNPRITTSSGQLVKVLSLKGAEDRDLAMISIEDANYSYLELATDLSHTVKTGDEVITPGNSEGGEVMLSTPGKILGIGPQRLEIDNPIYHGNSGGPVFHPGTNKVLGVVTFATKVEASDSLDKASFANGNSAISGSMRYFGLRVDTVPNWIEIDWNRFQTETAFLDEFHELNQCLDSYLNTSEKDPPSKDADEVNSHMWRSNDKIERANQTYLDQASGANSSQRLDALRQLQYDLNNVSDTNMDAIQDMRNFYSFDQERAKQEIAYRKALKVELDSFGNDLSRLGSAARVSD